MEAVLIVIVKDSISSAEQGRTYLIFMETFLCRRTVFYADMI